MTPQADALAAALRVTGRSIIVDIAPSDHQNDGVAEVLAALEAAGWTLRPTNDLSTNVKLVDRPPASGLREALERSPAWLALCQLLDEMLPFIEADFAPGKQERLDERRRWFGRAETIARAALAVAPDGIVEAALPRPAPGIDE